MAALAGSAARAASLITTPASLYLLATTVAAAWAHNHCAPVAKGDRLTRFAVCIPAHNEQAVIERTIASLEVQNYPVERSTIYVVADNCTDRTADLARNAGAIVHERQSPDEPGKGPALNWLYERLDAGSFDVLVILDADSVAEPGFLAAFDAAAPASAMQGFYGVHEPERATAVALRYAAIACRHHLRPLARTTFGASCGLYGNGMAFSADLMASRRWTDHLVEDDEFQLKLLLDGVRVEYVPTARLAAEMPDTLQSSRTQHERWELGRFQLLRRYMPLLFARTIRGGPMRRLAYADAMLDHLVPPLSVMAGLDVIGVVGGAAACLQPTAARRLTLAVSLLCSATLALHVLVALRLVGAPRLVYRSLTDAPKLVLWKLALLLKITRRPSDVRWIRTSRTGPAVAP